MTRSWSRARPHVLLWLRYDRLAGLDKRVDVRREVLPSDEYLARLAEADLLLLPYDPDV